MNKINKLKELKNKLKLIGALGSLGFNILGSSIINEAKPIYNLEETNEV